MWFTRGGRQETVATGSTGVATGSAARLAASRFSAAGGGQQHEHDQSLHVSTTPWTRTGFRRHTYNYLIGA